MVKREWLQVLIDEQLKHGLRVKAAQERENMTTAIEALIRLYTAGKLDELLAKESAATEQVAA